MCIWSEVAGVVLFLETGETKPRPFFGLIHLDQEEALIVAKGNVVARPVFLDQFTFEQNRFGFTLHGVGLKIPNRVQHGASLQISHCHFRGHEIGANAFAQIARFADVDDAVETIAHQINTGFVRHLVYLFR